MKDENKTKKQLINELVELRQRNAELEKLEIEDKQTEEVLRESESQLNLLFKKSPQAIAITEIETGRIINVNDKFCEITKYDIKEICEHTTTDIGFYSKADRERFIKELKASGEVTGLEMDFRIKDGSIVKTLMFARIIQLSGKTLILTTFQDVTEGKQAEEALRDSEERFRNLMEYIPESIQGYKIDGTIFYWNKASEKVYGYTAEEAIGKNLGDLIIPSNLKPLFKECIKIAKEVKQSGEFMPSGELMLLHKEGYLVPVYSIHTAVYIEGKEPLLFCIDVDLSQRKQTEEALKKSETELKQRVKELEDFYDMAVGRELRMIDLKKENEGLKEELEKYKKT